MARGTFGVAVQQVQRLFEEGTVAGLGEAQLLDRFLARRDEVAFAALVARHGPMVLGVCRRVLGDRHEAEDAFQATFLVLARRADSIRRRDLLGPWLYRIARRVATRASLAATRRRRRERLGAGFAEPAVEPVRRDLAWALQEELDRLPESYRRAVVLCYLDGLTHEEAAQRLHWPIGTVKGRLARARELLRSRLTRRGLTLSAGAVATALAEEVRAAVPSSLLETTTEAATRFAAGKSAVGLGTATAALLAEGVIRGMLLHKLKLGALGLVALGLVLAAGAGGAAGRPGADDPPAHDPNDRAAIRGDWEVVTIQHGRVSSPIHAPRGPVTITEKTIVLPYVPNPQFPIGERKAYRSELVDAEYTINDSREPHPIDFRLANGGWGDGTDIAGLYRLTPPSGSDPELLWVVYARPGEPRPTGFAVEPKRDQTLLVLRRRRGDVPKAAEPPAEPKKVEPEPAAGGEPRVEIQGLWEILGIEDNGKVEKWSPASTTIEITADRIIDRDRGVESARFRIGPADEPRDIDLISDPDPTLGKSPTIRRGIVRVRGDRLDLCLAAFGQERPRAFVSLAGSGHRLLHLRRKDQPAQTPAAGQAPARNTETSDAGEIQGHWEIVMIQVSGKLEDAKVPRRGIEITASTIITRDPHGGTHALGYRLGPAPRPPAPPWPRTIDLTPNGPREIGPTQLGICRLNGDTLMICLAGRGLDRPQTFESPPGSDLRLLVLKRDDTPSQKADAPPTRPEPGPKAEREGLARDIDDGRARIDLDEIGLDALKATIRTLTEQLDAAEIVDDAGIDLTKPGGVLNRSERERKELALSIARARDHLDRQRKSYLERRRSLNQQRRQLERFERQFEALGPEHVGESRMTEPRKIRPGDVLVISVLEALPGRPLHGERIVRSDGTISLEFYGDLKVAGLDRREAKVKLVEHMRKYLTDDILGLVGTDPETHKNYAIAPADSDRVFVDDSPAEEREARSKDVGEKLDRILEWLEANRRERNAKGQEGR